MQRVRETRLAFGVRVSTVFLGIDHAVDFRGVVMPILFGTMIFGAAYNNEDIIRYCTWKEAEEGHQKMVNYLISDFQKQPFLDRMGYSFQEFWVGLVRGIFSFYRRVRRKFSIDK